MAQTITFNGVSYLIPDVGDDGWGQNLEDYFAAIPAGALQKTGGTFTLTADVNFGANYGVKSKYFSSRDANPATDGTLRLANTNTIKWRNSGNSADIALTPGSSDSFISYAGIDLVNLSSAQTLSNKTFSGSIVYSGLSASQAVFTDSSKNLVSNAITGTGDVVMSGSPTLTGTITAAALTLSGTLGVSGVTTLNAALVGTSGAFSGAVSTGALDVGGVATFGTTANSVGNFSVNTNKFTVAASSGNTVVAGTLGVTGQITGNLTGNVTGNASGTSATFTGSLTGDVTSTAMATTIANNVVTNAKLATMATQTFKGRTTAGTGNAEDLTATQATAMLNVFGPDTGSGGVKGLVPATAPGDATKTLRGDGTWSSSGSGSVTSVSVVTANGVSGSVATATTTPAITLTLGAITPTSVAASGTVTGSNLSNTNSGDITLATVGSSPAAAGASLSGQVLTLQPANASNGGVVSTTTQTFAGAKTFTGTISGVSETLTGTLRVGTTSVATTPQELGTFLNNLTTDDGNGYNSVIGYTVQSTASPTTGSGRGVRGVMNRGLAGNVTDVGVIHGVGGELVFDTFGFTYTNTNVLAAVEAHEIVIAGGGTVNAPTAGFVAKADSTSKSNYKYGLYLGAMTGSASGNAGISDNQTFSGNYFIHSTDTNPSVLSGNVGIKMNPTKTLDVTGTFGATGAATIGGALDVTGVSTLANSNLFGTTTTLEQVLVGDPTRIRQIRLGNTSSKPWATIGTRITTGALALATNAYQNTENTDSWTQPDTSAASGRLTLSPSSGIVYAVAPSGSATAANATFWGSSLFSVGTTGNTAIAGTLDVTGGNISAAKAVSNSALTVAVNNSSAATGTTDANTQSQLRLFNDASLGLRIQQYASGATSAASPLTGGPTGVQAAIFTDTTYPMVIGTNNIAAITINTSQVVSLANALAATSGGTGQSSYTTGDMNYASATNTLSKRAIGSTALALKVVAGVPNWDFIVNARRESFMFEDWLASSATGSNAWTSTVQFSGAISILASEQTAPGIVLLDTSTSATAQAALREGFGAIVFGGGTWDYEWRVRFPTLSTSAEEYVIRVGMGDVTTGDMVDGAYFEYDRATSGDFWRIKTANNSSRTTTVSSTAIAANTWYKLRTQVNAGGTSVDFLVDDTNIGTITTNIPTGAGRTCGPLVSMIKTNGTTSRTTNVDYYWHHHVLSSAR